MRRHRGTEDFTEKAVQPPRCRIATLEIEATVPDGVPENVVRTVTENSRTLKFTSHGFEKE
jgi:hypothetical protein